MAPVYVETLPTSILPLPKRPGKGIINTIRLETELYDTGNFQTLRGTEFLFWRTDSAAYTYCRHFCGNIPFSGTGYRGAYQ